MTRPRARIKKGIRPYGGRTFDILERGTYRNGRPYVELDVTSRRTKFGLLGATSSPRRYDLDEVDLIPEVLPPALVARIRRSRSVIDSAEELLGHLSTLLNDAIKTGDTTLGTALAAEIDKRRAEIAAAVEANTPRRKRARKNVRPKSKD